MPRRARAHAARSQAPPTCVGPCPQAHAEIRGRNAPERQLHDATLTQVRRRQRRPRPRQWLGFMRIDTMRQATKAPVRYKTAQLPYDIYFVFNITAGTCKVLVGLYDVCMAAAHVQVRTRQRCGAQTNPTPHLTLP